MNTSARSISSIPVLEIGPIFAASCTAALVSRQILCASAERGNDGSMASRAPTRYAVTAAATMASGCLFSRALRKPSASAMRVAPRIPPSNMMSSVGARWRSAVKSQRLQVIASASGFMTLRSARVRMSMARSVRGASSAAGATRSNSSDSCTSSGTLRAPALARERNSAAFMTSSRFSLPSAITCKRANSRARSWSAESFR